MNKRQRKKAKMWRRVAEWEELKKTIDPKVLEDISQKIEEARKRMIIEAFILGASPSAPPKKEVDKD